MREIIITIRCTDLAEEMDLFTEVTGDVGTMEVVGLFEMAKKQFIESKQAPTIKEHAPDGIRVPPMGLKNIGMDEFHRYAPISPTPRLAECGQPYPCGHAPDGGNHPMAAGT